MSDDLVERAKAFVATVAGGYWDSVAAFLHPDVRQEEFPNRLVPNGATRDLKALKDAHERGGQVLSAETFEVVNAVGAGDCVAIEAIWTGTLAVAVGSLKPGDTMRARFAQFFEFRDGLIWRQRNYDCFEPF